MLNAVYEQFVEFVRPSEKDIIAKADRYPDEKSIEFDYTDLFSFSPSLAEGVLTEPDRMLRIFESAVKSVLSPDQQGVNLTVRVKNLHSSSKRVIGDFRSEDIGKLIYFDDCMVLSVSEVRPKMLSGVFTCPSCGFKQEIAQDALSYTEPLECPKEKSGCGKTNLKFIFHPDESLYVDHQTLEVQNVSNARGAQPGRVLAVLEDDLVQMLNPGDRVTLIAVQRIKKRKLEGVLSTTFNTYLHVHNVLKEHSTEDVLTDEDKQLIERIKTQDPLELLVQSFAPHIEGHDDIKLGLALQAFCGDSVEVEGVKIRQQFHVLLVGDPGTGKSELIMRAREFHPHGVFSTGKGTTVAGLTAGIVKANREGERSVLEAGVLVLADGGVAVIDEFEKMGKTDRDSMLEALEQQTISINKNEFKTTLQSRCAVSAAANPKGGRFNEHMALTAQFDIDPVILSRFGLIFSVKDEIDIKKDRSIARKIAQKHWNRKEIQTDYSPVVWRKYVKESKKIQPDFSAPELTEYLCDQYVKMRLGSQGHTLKEFDSIRPTARKVGDIIRISEAVARVYMDAVGKQEYIDVAIKLIKSGVNDTEEELYAGFKHTEKGTIDQMLEIIRRLSDQNDGKGAGEDEIISECVTVGIDDIRRRLDKLNEKGLIVGWGYGNVKVI